MRRKLAVPALLAAIVAALLSTPALANAMPENAALPARTASPRDWSKYAPDGKLSAAKITADSAILIDAQSGEVLFQKDPDTQRVPASITKIMTCLLALESGKDLSAYVTVNNIPAADRKDANIDLKNGETIQFEALLYGMMLMSGNDAADAIAMYVAPDGDIKTFVDMMNARAKELGMTHTHFSNTNGLPIENHYTTARDMAKLTMEAEKFPEFCKIVSTYKYTRQKTNKHTTEKDWLNHNRLINPSNSEAFSYLYATGVKTGFTDKAQRTLVASAEKDGHKLIAVALHDAKNKDWTDCITMFEYGFKFYDTVDVLELLRNDNYSTGVKNAAGNDPGMGKLSLLLKPQSTKTYITDVTETIKKIKEQPASMITSQMTITKDTAPIKRDEAVGTVTFSYNGKAVLVCDLLASRDVAEMPTPAPSASASATGGAAAGATGGATAGSSPAPGANGTAAQDGKSGSSFIVWVGVIALLLLIALIAVRFVNMQRRNRKYRQYNYRQSPGARLRR